MMYQRHVRIWATMSTQHFFFSSSVRRDIIRNAWLLTLFFFFFSFSLFRRSIIKRKKKTFNSMLWEKNKCFTLNARHKKKELFSLNASNEIWMSTISNNSPWWTASTRQRQTFFFLDFISLVHHKITFYTLNTNEMNYDRICVLTWWHSLFENL